MVIAQNTSSGLTKILNHLAELSVKHYYNPYQEFSWPDEISEAQYWMSPELLSVYHTSYLTEFSEAQLFRLSKWECINFFSLVVRGERGLLQSVIEYLYQPGFELWAEYFHHFIKEENEHMWFFAQFCLRYGGKIYKDKNLRNSQINEPDIEQFLAFTKILIFEEIGDFYNIRMQNDKRLHPLIQQISRVHHQDESRHLGMGREIVKFLFGLLQQKYPPEQLQAIANYLREYMMSSLNLFYNPTAYADAGLEKPYEWRRKLLNCSERQQFHQQVISRTVSFFEKNAILSA